MNEHYKKQLEYYSKNHIRIMNNQEYFCIPVKPTKTQKERKQEIKRIQLEAVTAGYNCKTIQNMTDHNKEYFTFLKGE